LRRAEEHYNETLLTLQKKKEQHKAFHREINDLKSHPGVQSTAKQTSTFKKKSSSTSHGSSINQFTHRSLSHQSTPIGKHVGYFELDGDSSEEPTTSDDEDKIGNVSTTHPNFSNPSPFKESSLNSSVLPSNDSGNDPSIKGSQDDPVKDEPKDTGLKSD